MLLKVKLNNFKSFKNLTELDFNATNYKILNDTNVYNNEILKGAIFVGGNATGKTNIILALRVLLDMLFSDKIINLGKYKCIFSEEVLVELGYEFNIEESNIKYDIFYDVKEKVLVEKLYLNDDLVLDRIGNNAQSKITESKSHTDLDNDVLLLRTIYFNTKFSNYNILKKWFEFLSNSVYLDASQRIISNSDKKIVLNKYLENEGTNEINEFFKEYKFNQQIEYSNQSIGNFVTLKLNDQSTKEIFFKRDCINEPIPYEWESLGNRNLINMLPAFFKVVKNGGMLIIDEFSSAFHNELERLLIKYFMNKSKNSQVFIVSHSTNLLSNSIFRPDQEYSVDFFENGSVVNRFSNDKPREAQNIEKMYNSGCFGGKPNYKPEYME
nr:ATP-binding protein [uncultured Romboutsia sp.]